MNGENTRDSLSILRNKQDALTQYMKCKNDWKNIIQGMVSRASSLTKKELNIELNRLQQVNLQLVEIRRESPYPLDKYHENFPSYA